MLVKNNSEFLFLFEAVMSNPNGDPDQENKPRMDYETNTLLVSDSRRKRDIRDFISSKGYEIFVNSLGDNKVPMDVMFDKVVNEVLNKKDNLNTIVNKYPVLNDLAKKIEFSLNRSIDYLEEKKKFLTNKEFKEKKADFIRFNNELITAIIKESLIDIRWFGSAMAVEGVSKTFTGPIQINWGYSLHPVEIIQSNTITSIMNDDSSTFGKKYKVHYALTAHHGTVCKKNAERTGLQENDLDLFRKAIVQGMISNQTDSKQGQVPLIYFEVIYKPEYDYYLGDLRRFINVSYDSKTPIRKLTDLKIDFEPLGNALEHEKVKEKIEKILLWKHPAVYNISFESLSNIVSKYLNEDLDLLEPIHEESKV